MRVLIGLIITTLIASSPSFAIAQPTSGTAPTRADSTKTASVRISDLNEAAAIKETTERILDIRTTRLGVQGERIDKKDDEIGQLKLNFLDQKTISQNESYLKDQCYEARKRDKKRAGVSKFIRFLEGAAIGVAVGIIITK